MRRNFLRNVNEITSQAWILWSCCESRFVSPEMRRKKRTGGKSRTESEDNESKHKYRFSKRRSSQIDAERIGINALTLRVLAVRVLTLRILAVRVLTLRVLAVRVLTVRFLTGTCPGGTYPDYVSWRYVS